jgi:site-specific recombinase XerD
MSALANNTIFIKTDFYKELEKSKSENDAELRLMKNLYKYTNDSFLKSVWCLDVNTKKIEPVRISFRTLNKYGNIYTKLSKLYAIILLERGKTALSDLPSNLNVFFEFLNSKNINLLKCDSSTLIIFEEWLNEQDNRFKESTKKRLFNTVKSFFNLLYGHSKVSKIDGVLALENPYKDSNSERYKEIDSKVLEKYDEYFQRKEVKLFDKVIYWILRLYGVRPSDLTNYPLDCVKKLSKEIATIKHAIVKNSSNDIDYKIEFLNLSEPKQKLLYKLIEELQLQSQALQDEARKKGFLFTYKFGTVRYANTQKIQHMMQNVSELLNIPKELRATPKDFKKTAITLRAKNGWTSEQLKIFANHSTYDSLDAYSRPSDMFTKNQQKEILKSEGRLSSGYVFNGKIINKINTHLEKKIMSNLRAHKISNLGYCPNVAHCGNHFECLDCEYLLPDYDLKDYYISQADRYLEIAEKQNNLNDTTNARDSFHRASLFAQLFNKVINEKGDANG